MRLKVSPKEALKIVDGLVAKGYNLSQDPYFSTSFANKGEIVDTWFDEARVALKKIFFDSVPIYRVLKCRKSGSERLYNMYLIKEKEKENPPEEELERALDVLVAYYDYFVTQEKSPVRYLVDKAEIWLYDICCPLVPESNESELCRYMFNLGIGEWAEMAEIHKTIVGGEYDPNAKNKNIVVNALDGVNSKTKDSFDFPLLKKRKSVVALAIPSRFILDQK